MPNSYAIINTCDFGSTGKIAIGLLNYLKEKGEEAIFCYGRGNKQSSDDRYLFSSNAEVVLHYVNNKITGQLNSSSVFARRLINKLRQRKVKNIFIINLHGYYINEKMFLDYLISDQINVVYIMADESAFLGNCTYRNGCENYLKQCVNCPKQRGISKILFPKASNLAYLKKLHAYNAISNIVFVAPEFVIKSSSDAPLLKGKMTSIVDEAIDVQVNHPKDTSLLRRKLGIADDVIVIGCVAPYSYERKGVRFLIDAARRLQGDKRFVFVQVGYDSKDKSHLPSNYIPIGYVSNQDELTEYYSLADLFVFPSLQDTMPNACLEALACGSPLLCFDISGMPYIADETVMTLVEPKNIDHMVSAIVDTKKKTEQTIQKCRDYALNRFDNQKYFSRLLEIMNKFTN